MAKEVNKTQKKKEYFSRLISYINQYKRILIVNVDHVGSRQMSNIRRALRGKAIILMGKNTMMRAIIKSLLPGNPELENLMKTIVLNMGFVFCINEPSEIKEIILEYRVPAPAKQGVIAPIDVSIPAGPTGLDPSQTSFFQALGIATKIVKGQIEIQSDVSVITKDLKVTASQSVLLQKLNIKPFSYGLKISQVYDSGSLYDASVMDITSDYIFSKMKQSAAYLASFSLQVGIPTKVSVPHSILRAFKFLAAAGLSSEYSFSQLIDLQNTKSAAQVIAPVEESTVKKELPVEEEEEEDDDMGFGLFD